MTVQILNGLEVIFFGIRRDFGTPPTGSLGLRGSAALNESID